MTSSFKSISRFGIISVLLFTPWRVEAAGGAYAVDDADIGEAGSCQNEAWISTASSRDFAAVESPACVVRMGLPIELSAFYQRARTASDWATTGGGQAKAVPYNTETVAISWVLGTYQDFTVNRHLMFANFPLTYKFSTSFRVHTNLGWLYDGRVNVNYATGGVGFDWDFAKNFSLMGEVYLQQGRATNIASVTRPRSQIGLRFIPISTVDIDLIYGNNITGRSGHWITLGLTIRSR